MKPRNPPIDVLHIITSLDAGGAENQLTTLCCLMHQQGYHVGVVSLMTDGIHAEHLKNNGVPLWELGLARRYKSYHLIFALIKLIRLLWTIRPKVIQSWLYHADLAAFFALYLSGRRHRTKLYWNLRCSNMAQAYYRSQGKIRTLLSRFSPYVDGVVSNAKESIKVHQKLGYNPPRWRWIPNGIDVEKFQPNLHRRQQIRDQEGIHDQQIIILQVARVDPQKDYPTLLEAVKRLDQQAICWVVGLDTEKLPAHPQLKRWGLRRDIPDLMAAADIMVLSAAFGEGFSNVLGEGMASGLPVLATDVGDARHIVDTCGVIIPPKDVNSLVNHLDKMLQWSSEKRKSQGVAARARIIEHFSWPHIVKQYAIWFNLIKIP
ncbi:glycosyltransferase [Magnetococcales bacterium HHB-1]